MPNYTPWETTLIKPTDKYGRLTVLSTHKIDGTYRYFAKCQCDCGNPSVYIRIDGMRKGISLSCGCLQKDKVTKHGAWGHPLFATWSAMLRRCYNPKDKRYHQYHDRGITVCDHWHNVKLFIKDMSKGYQKGLQIDRINNDKGYYKGNCRWTDRTTQARNKTSSIQITFNNKTQSLIEWSHFTGISYGTLWDRIKVRKWSIEKALTQKP